MGVAVAAAAAGVGVGVGEVGPTSGETGANGEERDIGIC